jgi:hypothetical protein
MTLELSEFLRPSRAKTWASCLASPGFCFQNQDRLVPFSTEDQDEGTRIHAYAAAVLKGIDPQDPDIPPELWEAAMGFVAYVQSIKADIHEAVLHVEETIPRGYAPGTCTPDVQIYNTNGEVLHIIDLKAGIGVEIEATQNLQLLLYSYASIQRHGLMPHAVSLHIYMPRHHTGEKRDVFTVRPTDTDYPVPDVHTAAKKILADPFNQPFTPSDEACQFCSAQAFCSARTQQATAAIQLAELRAIDLGDFASLTDEKLAKMYRAIPAAKKYFNKLESYVESRATTGVKFPGLKLVVGRQGNRKWADEKKAFSLLRKLFPGESCREISVIGVADADKLIKSHVRSDRLSEPQETELFAKLEKLITRADGSPTLVPETDARPALAEIISAEFQPLNP